ncbi:futalosine hydrolase [Mucilaginibacter lacusdianchii]|uniref:futalosine hydrolase n=1 Tax=Mucilaginibacter lacusdianchii TaxID=2684211 RepID=UPI00131B86D7|nr:futalosine hydrolase [Mucilaginibacter sp. JXJ CY 39]
MNILVVAATRPEIAPLLEMLNFGGQPLHAPAEDCIKGILYSGTDNDEAEIHNITCLITGVGMVATGYSLGRHLAINHYDLAINLGIAGSFDRSIELGDVVEITDDTFAELGAEDDETFLTIEKMGFGESRFKSSAKLAKLYSKTTLQQVTAVTVNTVHGNQKNIDKLIDRLPVQLESMEGAAFFYACTQAGVPSLQIRAVSNYVEKRNRDAWKIGLAIKNLNSFAEKLLSVIGSQL